MSTLKANKYQHVDRSSPSIEINSDGSVSISSTVTYEDVTSVDAVGLITARSGLRATAGGLEVTAGISTFNNGLDITGNIVNGLNVSAGVGTFGGDVSIADKIIHTGDTNTTIRFPGADIITTETGGTERLRCDSDGVKTSNGRFYSAGTFAYIESSSDSVSTLTLRKTHSDADSIDYLQCRDNSNAIKLTVSGDGTVKILDSIVHEGDTNTKIRFPSADTFTVETGGSERLRIDSNGLIANNNRNPSSYGSPNLLISGTDSTLTLMGDGSTDNTSYTGIKFRVAGASTGDYTKAGIFAQRQGGYNDLDLIFAMDTAADANSVAISDEKMRITAGGEVGIGITNPTKTGIQNNVKVLQIDGGDGAELILGNSQSSNVSTNHIGAIAFTNIDTTSGDAPHYAGIRCNCTDTSGNMNLKFYGGSTQFEADTPHMVIDSTGRLLVGHNASETMFYTGLLQVQGTSSSTSAITVKTNQNDSGGPAIVLGKSRGAAGSATVVQDGDELGCIYFNGADGTDTNSRAAAIRCTVDGSPGSNDMPGRLVFLTTADGASTGTERMRITSTGQLRIGNTTETQYTAADDLIIGTGSGDRGLTIYSGSSDAGVIAYSDGTSDDAYRKGQIIYDHSANDMIFKVDGNTERLSITTDKVMFSVDAKPNSDNTRDLGASGARWKDLYLSSGVFLGGTGSANELTDYEEGTFTPVVSGDGGTAGTWNSGGDHTGVYRKIGTLVFIAIQVSGSISAAGNGNLQITGLPFTSGSVTGGHGQALALGPLFNWDIDGSAYQIGGRVNDGGTTIKFWNNFDNAADSLLGWPFGSSGTKYGSIAGCYVST